MMQENYKQKADKFHIIGHSIGAHAAGEVGSRIPGLARITGDLCYFLMIIQLIVPKVQYING